MIFHRICHYYDVGPMRVNMTMLFGKTALLKCVCWVVFGIALTLSHFHSTTSECVLPSNNPFDLPADFASTYVIVQIILKISYIPITYYNYNRLRIFNEKMQANYGTPEPTPADEQEVESLEELEEFKFQLTQGVINQLYKGSECSKMYHRLNSGIVWKLHFYLIVSRLIWNVIGFLVLMSLHGAETCENVFYFIFLWATALECFTTLFLELGKLGLMLTEHPHFSKKLLRRARAMDRANGSLPLIQMFVQVILLVVV